MRYVTITDIYSRWSTWRFKMNIAKSRKTQNQQKLIGTVSVFVRKDHVKFHKLNVNLLDAACLLAMKEKITFENIQAHCSKISDFQDLWVTHLQTVLKPGARETESICWRYRDRYKGTYHMACQWQKPGAMWLVVKTAFLDNCRGKKKQ